MEIDADLMKAKIEDLTLMFAPETRMCATSSSSDGFFSLEKISRNSGRLSVCSSQEVSKPDLSTRFDIVREEFALLK